MNCIVKQIIDRDCHVGESNRAVIKHVVSKLGEGHKTFRGMPREDRRELMRYCVECHKQNFVLYSKVMS